MLDFASRSSARSLHLDFWTFWSFKELILEFLVEIRTWFRRKKTTFGSAQSICYYQFEVCIIWVLHWHLVKGYLCFLWKTREDIRAGIASSCDLLVVFYRRIWGWNGAGFGVLFCIHHQLKPGLGSVSNLQWLGLILWCFKDQDADFHSSRCEKPKPKQVEFQTLSCCSPRLWCRCCPWISTSNLVKLQL